MTTETENIAQTVARLVNADAVQPVVGDDSVIAVPEHWKSIDLEQYMEAPRRIKVKRQMATLEGFRAYVALHAIADRTAVYVDHQQALAVIDDIKPGANEPAWQSHQAVLALTHTAEWRAWEAASGQFMPQREFVNFVQDRAGEIVQPDLATLVQQLQSIDAQSSGSRRDVSGHLTAEQKREQSIRITNDLPEYLDLVMPMLTCEPDQSTTARARLMAKLNEGGVTFSVTVVNAPVLVDQRIREFAGRVRDGIGKNAMVYF